MGASPSCSKILATPLRPHRRVTAWDSRTCGSGCGRCSARRRRSRRGPMRDDSSSRSICRGAGMSDARPTPLHVVVVDDEQLARAVIREYLADVPDVEIIAECGNGFEAVKAVADLHPDVLLLDVQMPKLDGFEVLELVGSDVA